MATPPLRSTEESNGSQDPRYTQFMQAHGATRKFIVVIAKIENLDAWQKLVGVKTRTAVREETGWIVTAQILADQFPELQKLPFVTSLKMGQAVNPFT